MKTILKVTGKIDKVGKGKYKICSVVNGRKKCENSKTESDARVSLTNRIIR